MSIYSPLLHGPLLRPFGTGAGGSPLLDGSESDGTNIFSQNISAGDGTTIGTTRSYNVGLSPDGTTTAALVTEDTSTNRHILYFDSQPGSANKTRATSIYAKPNGRRYLQITCEVSAIFDLQTGTVTDVDTGSGSQSAIVASCQAAMNGFYKCTVQFFDTGPAGGYYVWGLSDRSGLVGANAFGNVLYTGDGSSGLYLWRSKLTQV